jgi:hypothetical protein
VAHILGVFQEMGSFNLDIVKENMFRYKTIHKINK